MSELKSFDIVVAEEGYGEGIVKYRRAVYDKSEADNVIADLEESHKKEVEQLLIEIVKLKADYREACGRLQTANLIKDEQLAVTRHSKYKRCLAMADMCSEAVCYWDNVKYTFFKGEAYCFRKLNHYGKWGQIWLAIAEKLKEAK